MAQSLNDGDVLPAGVGGLILGPGIGYGNGVLERYGPGWRTDRESILADVDGVDLAAQIGPPDTVRAALGGDIGTLNMKGSVNSFALNLTGAYGITERLTVAVLAPYQWVKYTVDASLSYTGDVSDFRVAPNSLSCPGGNFNFGINDLATLGGPQDNYKFNIGDLQRILTSPCFGYDEIFDRIEITDDGIIHGIQDRTKSGFRDIALGAKYQFFKGRHIRVAALGYVVAGTGTPVSPTKLIDFKLGDGNWNTGLVLAATVPLGKLRFGLGVGYDIELPDSERLRLFGVGFSPEREDQFARGEISEQELLADIDNGNIQPLVTRFDVVEVDRKLGNNINVYGMSSYQLFEWLSVGASFTFFHHFRDRISSIGQRPDGASPYPTEQEVRNQVQGLIDDGTITEEQRVSALKDRLPGTVERRKAAYGWHTVRGQLGVTVGLNFNTLGMFSRDEFPLPLIGAVGITRFIAGQNIDTPDALSLNLIIPFITGEIIDPNSWGYDDEGEGPPFP